MIIQNTTQFELRTRYNRYLQQDVLDIIVDGEWVALGALTAGSQRFAFGILAETILPDAVRSPCDLQLAQTTLSPDC